MNLTWEIVGYIVIVIIILIGIGGGGDAFGDEPSDHGYV